MAELKGYLIISKEGGKEKILWSRDGSRKLYEIALKAKKGDSILYRTFGVPGIETLAEDRERANGIPFEGTLSPESSLLIRKVEGLRFQGMLRGESRIPERSIGTAERIMGPGERYRAIKRYFDWNSRAKVSPKNRQYLKDALSEWAGLDTSKINLPEEQWRAA